MQGRRQKIFQGGVNGKKNRKLAKKYRKIALFSLFQGGGGEEATKKKTKKRKKSPKKENSTFKPLSTIFVPCLKIRGTQPLLTSQPTPMIRCC